MTRRPHAPPAAPTRRDLLAAAALGLAGPGLMQWPQPAAAAFSDYKALVCVFLFGGNDAFNLLVPRSLAEYGAYAASRQNLAVGRDSLLAITPATPDGAQYGLHPAVPELRDLFAAGRLAFLANIGPLVEPVTKASVLDLTGRVPPQLFSHNDQQDQWQSLRGQLGITTGWAGRAADAIATDTAAQLLPVNVSVTGTNLLQIGTEATPYAIGTGGAVPFQALEPGAPLYAERRAAFERLLALRQPSLYGRAVADVNGRSLRYAATVTAALAAHPDPATPFPDSPLAAQLRLVARLIAARDELQMARQVFLVAAGGFDTHDSQNALQPGLLAGVSQAVGAFHAATIELGVADRVVTFTASDFGRTLTSNGDGTDHGWGGHQFAVGGPVRGGDIYGAMPLLALDGPDDLGAGRIVPTLSVDQYAATLLRWFGLPAGAIDDLAPNLGNFPVREIPFL